MNIPLLFDVVDMHLISKWRDEFEKDNKCLIMDKPSEEKQILTAQLNDEQKKLLNYFELSLINKLDYIYYYLCRQLFYFSIKAGMDMQKAYDDED